MVLKIIIYVDFGNKIVIREHQQDDYAICNLRLLAQSL